jgi:hypothetical protein
MKNLSEIRFVATNFSNLQGLRAVPLSLLLVIICLWANGLHGPARDFLVPILGLASSLILFVATDRYYLHSFGRVQRTPESRRLEWLTSIVGGILALGAFWVEISFVLPFSLLGIVFAVCLLVDYIRITWLVKGRFLIYYPIGAILLAMVSILPLLGVSHWWQVFGLRSQLLGMSIAFGVFMTIAGIWGHIFLVTTLPSQVKNNQ